MMRARIVDVRFLEMSLLVRIRLNRPCVAGAYYILLIHSLTPSLPMSTDTIQVSQTRVYIVRHAETEENEQKIIQGHLDTILNSEGERQADLLAKALKDIPFDVAYSSDLKRATDTAKRILVHHSGVKVQTHIAIRERVRRGLRYPVCLSLDDN
jgi:hypothetical protein